MSVTPYSSGSGPVWIMIMVIKSDRYAIYPTMWLWPVLTFTWPTYKCDKKVNDNVWAISLQQSIEEILPLQFNLATSTAATGSIINT
jgi:hypothetical protein